MKIIYDERGGTREVEVSELEALRWALSLSQAERVAQGVRAVSKAYGGIIMSDEHFQNGGTNIHYLEKKLGMYEK